MKKDEAFKMARDLKTQSIELVSLYGISVDVDRTLALHPNASSSLLSSIAQAQDKLAKKFVLVHPHLSLGDFFLLAAKFFEILINSPHLHKLTDDQIFRLSLLVNKKQWSRLLAEIDCPVNVLLWAAKNGDHKTRMLLAKRHVVPLPVKEILQSVDGAAALEASKPRGLILNSKGVLVGDFSRRTEIDGLGYDSLIFERDFADAIFDLDKSRYWKELPRPAAPDFLIKDDGVIEVLKINASGLTSSYACIENLPNLKRIEVVESSSRGPGSFIWLRINNTPLLEEVALKCGSLGWIEINNAPLLRLASFKKCSNLSVLRFLGANRLEVLEVSGCKMLRAVDGLDSVQIDRLGVVAAIAENQLQSMGELKLKKSMTFTEIDAILDVLNRGLKAAVRKGLLRSDDPSIQLCYGRENDPNYCPFSYRTLEPLEPVYTGGTGENYFYELLCHDYVDGKYGIWNSEGWSEPADFLKAALNKVAELAHGRHTPNGLLQLFKNALALESNRHGSDLCAKPT